MKFPDSFVWGSATASYQIEGSESIEGLSVWDMMCRQPDKVFQGHTGKVACDHYNRFREDIGLMADMGLKHYRLSISWPRVMPTGTGQVNEKGMEFYDQLIDELLSKDITPWVTLFHWDYPYELFLRGGWTNRDSADWFAEYTEKVVLRLSDRVSNWMTMNEPQCFIGLGLQDGVHAPGLKMGFGEVLAAAHNTMRAHGKSVKVIRENAKTKPSIGWVITMTNLYPENDNPDTVEKTRSEFFSVDKQSVWCNTWFTDPLFFGKYPEDGVKLYGDLMPEIQEGDMETINQPLDFLGLNCYNGTVVTSDSTPGEPQTFEAGYPHTTMEWPVTPEILYWSPKFYFERYKTPIYITENGMANTDFVSIDGQVHDPQRIDFLNRYLCELGRAIEDGVDVRGYFQWSFMDNFEWSFGYSKRFGLTYVDYETQKRTPKDSAKWYAEVIKTNGANL